MSTVTAPRLTPQQVRQYRTEGYLIHDRPVFPQAKFDACWDGYSVTGNLFIDPQDPRLTAPRSSTGRGAAWGGARSDSRVRPDHRTAGVAR